MRFASLALLSVACVSCTAKTSPPRAEVDQELSYDFGTAPIERKGRHAWNIKNAGRKDLQLWLAQKPTCGCTVSTLMEGEKRVLKAGEATEIALEWVVNRSKEDYAQKAVIGTSDPERPEISLVVKGKIYAPVDATAQSINFDTFFGEQPRTASTIITSADRPDLALTNVYTSRPDLMTVGLMPLTSVEAKALKVMSGCRITVDLKPGMPRGRFNESMVIQTNHPSRPEMSIPVQGVVTGAISVLTGGLRLPAGNQANPVTTEDTLIIQDGRPTKFEVKHKPKDISVVIRPRTDNVRKGTLQYKVVATTPSGTTLKPGSSSIILSTDHPKEPSVVVPVSIRTPGPHISLK